MNNSIEALTECFLQSCGKAGESERRVIERLGKRHHISRDTNRQFAETLTFGERLADRVAILVVPGSSF